MKSFRLFAFLILTLLLAAPIARGAKAENTAAACRDGKDNDGDGLVDCDDPDCRLFKFCDPGKAENTPEACRDGKDNDGDGHVDCADADCAEMVFCEEPREQPAASPATAPRGPAPDGAADQEPASERMPPGEIRRGPGLRLGVSGIPTVTLFTGSGTTSAIGGLAIAGRAGYQWNNRFGLVAELHLALLGSNNLSALSIAGSVLVEVHFAGRFFVAVGPSVGVFDFCESSFNSCSFSPVAGGPMVRAGIDLLQKNRPGGGSTALSIALDFRPLFYTVAVSQAVGLGFGGEPTSGPSRAINAYLFIGLSVGYERY